MCASALDNGDGVIHIEGLWEVVEGSALIGRYSAFQIRMRRHDDDRTEFLFGEFLKKLEAVHAGHAHIRDDHGRSNAYAGSCRDVECIHCIVS